VKPTVSWEGNEVPVASTSELDALVDQLTLQAREKLPFIVTVARPDGATLSIGVGRDESVASYVPASLDPPYYLSRSGAQRSEPIEFVFSGQASEYPPESVISVEAARRALRTFFETGELTGEIAWEET
jgi:hypothetical protein